MQVTDAEAAAAHYGRRNQDASAATKMREAAEVLRAALGRP